MTPITTKRPSWQLISFTNFSRYHLGAVVQQYLLLLILVTMPILGVPHNKGVKQVTHLFLVFRVYIEMSFQIQDTNEEQIYPPCLTLVTVTIGVPKKGIKQGTHLIPMFRVQKMSFQIQDTFEEQRYPPCLTLVTIPIVGVPQKGVKQRTQFHQPRLVIRTFHRQGRCSRGGHLCNEHNEETYSCSYK